MATAMILRLYLKSSRHKFKNHLNLISRGYHMSFLRVTRDLFFYCVRVHILLLRTGSDNWNLWRLCLLFPVASDAGKVGQEKRKASCMKDTFLL